VKDSAFKFVVRRKREKHFPVLIFDPHKKPHLPFSRFAQAALKQVTLGTLVGYLYAILPFITFIATDDWQVRAGRQWNSPPDKVRDAIEDFLTLHLQCKLREHKNGFQMVGATGEARRQLNSFLSGMRLFYAVMNRLGYYPYENPFIDSNAILSAAFEEDEVGEETFPRMPEQSGVVEPRPRKKRLTDSYYKQVKGEWIPQIVDDPELYDHVLAAGSRMHNWGKREFCITRGVFETGGRISEVIGFTLGDWVRRGMKREVWAFSKGSRGERVKILRFTNETAKLMRTYFNKERIRYDPHGWTLEDYLRAEKLKKIDLRAVPFFLSSRGTPFTPKAYRENYWNPACAVAGLDVDVHQARHWYVTMAVRLIYQIARDDVERNRMLEELIQYMKWASGWEVLGSYNHYFDAARHYEVQDALFERMREIYNQHSSRGGEGQRSIGKGVMGEALITSDVDTEFGYLQRIGGRVIDN
jgi:integrase